MKPLLFFMCAAFSIQLQAQNRTNIWEIGNVNVSTHLSCYIDFNYGFADTVSVMRTMNFYATDGEICDTDGQLLFYTNGVYVANRNHDTLLNSENFNPGSVTDFYNDDGLGISQGAIVLNQPGTDWKYWIFTVSGELGLYYDQTFSTLRLAASVVDMSLDLGLGGIPNNLKNITILEDTLEFGRLTACKHANGRDWWIITHKFHSDRYYIILLSDTGYQLHQQTIGNQFDSFNAVGMAVFSPDGSLYAHLNINDTIDLLKFNRCTGEFSEFKSLTVPKDSGGLFASLSCSFSPSSRFLYVNTYKSIYQFDTWASDIELSKIKVGEWEDQNGWPDYFFLQQVSPEGKIYISLWNADKWMHVINNPDSLGILCDFVQHGLDLPETTNFCVPNFPNYDLDSLPGNDSCNAVYTSTIKPANPNGSFKISPNPVSHWLDIIYNTSEDASFELFDLCGKKERAISLFHYFKNRLVDVSDLPAGVYLAVVTQKGKQVWSEKVVVAH